MTDKICSMEDVRKAFSDGLTVMVGGFGVPGTPFMLVDALLASGASGLTLIKNEANEDHMGVSKLIEAGQVRKIITSHLGLNATVIGIMNRGEIDVEFYPQGILAEKIRTGGAGLYGFLTDIGIDTILKEKKQTIIMDGREVIVEPALTAGIALIHAAVGDRNGNLVYEKSARNFNPVMATAARTVIAEVEQVVEIGALAPDHIHTPGAFVDHVIEIKELTAEYGILAHHVI
jgi:acetate CoA/acetoacetate CoA-transferase alpha subunit